MISKDWIKKITSFIIFVLILVACKGESDLRPRGISRIRVIWNKEPATHATIAWDAGVEDLENQRLYFDTVDHGQDYQSYSYQREIDSYNDEFDMYNAFVRLKGLIPDTNYYFVIGDGKNITKRYYFKTATNSPDKPISIIAGGDSRDNWEIRKKANKMVSKLIPDLVFFGGDFTDDDNSSQWKRWMDDWQLTIANDGRVTPLVVARGNHERSNDTLVSLFDTPEKVYYSTELGGGLLKLITLNSESSVSGDQADWLEDELANSTEIWKMAQYHSPMRPHTSSKPNNSHTYDAFAHLFYDYNVNLVMECDSHMVKSTFPIRPSYEAGSDEGFIEDERGTVYLGEGTWGAPLRKANDGKSWTRSIGSFNQVTWIFFDLDKIQVRTIKYENVDEVEALSSENRFLIPSNLDIWAPRSGEVLEIKR